MTADPKELKTRIAIDRIVDLAETRDIRPVDRDHVGRLAIAVETLPPVDVVKLDGGRLGLLAGYHRRGAHRLAGVKTMRVVVHDLDPEEWFGFAVRSNLAHGLPLTMAQRKAAATRMLDEGDQRSDRAIGANCGIDNKTVANIREQLREHIGTAGEEVPHLEPERRIGRDGKTYPGHGKTRQAERLAAKANETAAALDHADAPITKPDLGGGISHPARFPDAVLDELAAAMVRHGAGTRILDPFAGTGRIHQLNAVLRPGEPFEIFSIELEPGVPLRLFVDQVLDDGCEPRRVAGVLA